MKGAALFLLAGQAVWAALPLHLAAVERAGLPPYEGPERVYRLEGAACDALRVGERLALRRQGDPRRLGQLEILSVHPDHAEARLSEPGETFPLVGDLACRAEPLRSLPQIPAAPLRPLPAAAAVRPSPSPRPLPQVPVRVVHREPIYFIKDDATLSPGAYSKLKLWTETWGTGGRWSLECPPAAISLTSLRVSALRSELQRLGVSGLEIVAVPEGPPSEYDPLYVKHVP